MLDPSIESSKEEDNLTSSPDSQENANQNDD
jgi:hypothetical protein